MTRTRTTVKHRKSLAFEAPAVVRRWKKFLVCGCSHGQLSDPAALMAVTSFRDEYKPDFTAHLGDFTDTTAWRAGASGTPDEGADVADDMFSGLTFLEELEPQAVFIGNHEQRIYKHLNHTNAIVRTAATATVENLRRFITGELKARFVESYDIMRSWLTLGDCIIGHGFMFNEAAIRDHAEFHGRNVIIAHLHRQGMERARSVRGATGWCVGYLGDPEKFTYANTHKAKAKWQRGFAFGEYTDNETRVNLHQIPCQKPEFPAV